MIIGVILGLAYFGDGPFWQAVLTGCMCLAMGYAVGKVWERIRHDSVHC